MLQLSYIKDNTDLVLAGLRKRGFPQAEQQVQTILQIDTERRALQFQLDQKLGEANALAKEIGALMKSGRQAEADQAKATTAALKTESRDLETRLADLENQLQQALVVLPNIPQPIVPEGRTADDNVEIYISGPLPEPIPGALPHWELIKKYDIIDFDLGTKITGAGFPVYKGKGARIQRALINFFLDQAEAAGYREHQVPIMVNEDSAYGTGQLPDKEGQMYHAVADDLFLIPTSEVPLTNIYRDVILSESDLPVKLTGYTPCFRREAGSWGAHVRGLNRLHQFDKVEIVRIEHPERSYAAHDEMIEHVKGLMLALELPFRIIRLCGGDMGFTSSLTYDFEVWSSAQQRWLEVSSVSNFETFQANRLKLRYKAQGDKKTTLLHTLNGSALALPRILAALLENNQTPEGINIPGALHPYTGFTSI